MLESTKKETFVLLSYFVWPKQTTNKATKRLQRQNRMKYETIVQEIRLQLTQVMQPATVRAS